MLYVKILIFSWLSTKCVLKMSYLNQDLNKKNYLKELETGKLDRS